jgi:hypothetical protein
MHTLAMRPKPILSPLRAGRPLGLKSPWKVWKCLSGGEVEGGPLKAFNFGCKANRTQHAVWRLELLTLGSVDARQAVILIGANNLGAGDTVTGVAAGF